MRSSVIISFLATVWLFLLCGCPKQQPPAISGQGPASPPQVTAYLDITRGCMSETQQLLKDARVQYADELDIRIFDISERPRPGQTASTVPRTPAIYFGDSHTVSWPRETGPPQVVRFNLPPGYYWRRGDLQDALEALAAGRLRAATENELKNLQKLPPKKIQITAQTLQKRAEPPVGQILINGTLAISVPQTEDNKDPSGRVNRAVETLNGWTKKWYSPRQLAVENQGDEAVLQADGTPVLTVTAADAQAAEASTPRALAEQWRAAIARPMLCPSH